MAVSCNRSLRRCLSQAPMTPRAGNPTRDVPIPWHVRRCRQTHRARGPRTPGARRRRHRVYSRCGSRCARHRVARCRECGLMHRSTQPTRVVRPTAAVPPARPSQRAMAGRRFERSRGVARQILARRRRCGRCRPPRAMCNARISAAFEAGLLSASASRIGPTVVTTTPAATI